ncbi:MAG: asparagine synthase (glutamine-hydrolyzing) [Anaerolineae bacterium]|nr:asparagine synthase (glutamine-hydrolyzing) [Anaerolineae bacterium]
MCGICGQVLFDPEARVDPAELRRMTEAIIHRGPDSDGYYLEDTVGLGMRRLRIIDLETGEQPIANEDGSLWIVLNGEIYNYVELRPELEARGHVFRTRSDTETILHLYEDYGPECLEHLNGMYAFAIWDRRRRELFIARDRLGIKPLFYAVQPGRRLIFGSEIKSLLQTDISREPDYLGLHDYLSLFYVPTPRSAFKEIHKLPPGHWLRCRADGTVQIERYWDVPFPTEGTGPRSERQPRAAYVEQIRHLLRESVRRQLRSDVPLGVFLSGGLDSTSVVAFMSELLDQPVRTFSIGFQEPSYNELPEARLVAQAFETEHHELVVEPDLIDLIPKIVLHFDEPFADYSAIPTYLVSQMARQEVTVVLSGDGGDELFAGYQTHYAYRVARLYRLLPRLLRDRVIAPLVKRLPTSTDRVSFDFMAKRFVTGAHLPFERGHYWWKVILNEDEKRGLYAADLFHQVQRDSYEVFAPYFDAVRGAHPLNQLLYVDTHTFLLDDGLVKVDRMSMAHSLEVRVPLLDHELVEYLAQVPPTLKSSGLNTKSLLRDVVRPLLPPTIVKGKKKGFTPPLPVWLKNDLRDFVQDTLSPARIRDMGLLRPEAVSQILDDHFAGRRDNNRPIWTILCFVLWHENLRR